MVFGSLSARGAGPGAPAAPVSILYPKSVAPMLIDAIPGCTLPQIESLVEVLFFASLLREEGHDLTFNVVYPGLFEAAHPTPERQHGWAPWHAIDFATPDLFTPSNVAKHALLAHSDSEYLIVHAMDDTLKITGVGHQADLPWFGDRLLTARVVHAGSIRFFYGSKEILSYSSGAVESIFPWPFAAPLRALNDVTAALGAMTELAADKREFASAALNMLSTELIRRRHGGIIAVLSQDDLQKNSTFGAQRLTSPLDFGATFAKSWEASTVNGNKEEPAEDEKLYAQDASLSCARALGFIGGMTTVDGAVLATPALSVVGFRAKLPAPDWIPKVMRRTADGTLEHMDMTLTGMRHRSAACFVGETPGRIVLIRSADGPAAAMFQDDGGEVIYWPIRDTYGPFSL